jgi:hypothetical protein
MISVRCFSVAMFLAVVSASSFAYAQNVGCADGAREGFSNISLSPNVAGCSGAWSLPDVRNVTRTACTTPGDDGSNTAGTACRAIDVCAANWHICATAAEITTASYTNSCTGIANMGDPNYFFVTQQSGVGSGSCDATGSNDLFGCGNYGGALVGPGITNCPPLNYFSNNLCSSLGAPWSCGSDGVNEIANVTKTNSTNGGVLCCRDDVASCACYIGSTCYASGAVNPANGCEVCTPGTARNAWSPRAAGTSCNDGLFCTTGETCNAAGACNQTLGATNCADTLACTTDTCNEAGDTCVNTIDAGFCNISNSCIASNATNPGNQCQACIPATSTTAYSPKSLARLAMTASTAPMWTRATARVRARVRRATAPMH